MYILIGMEIQCTKCEQGKDSTEFRKRKGTRHGYQYWCRQCESEANKKRYLPAIKKLKKPIDVKEVKRKAKERMLKHRYDITIDEYNQLYDNQGGRCKICGDRYILGTTKGLVVDHCHTTMEVRGLLCGNCNTGLGKFKDDIELLNKAIEYIK